MFLTWHRRSFHSSCSGASSQRRRTLCCTSCSSPQPRPSTNAPSCPLSNTKEKDGKAHTCTLTCMYPYVQYTRTCTIHMYMCTVHMYMYNTHVHVHLYAYVLTNTFGHSPRIHSSIGVSYNQSPVVPVGTKVTVSIKRNSRGMVASQQDLVMHRAVTPAGESLSFLS